MDQEVSEPAGTEPPMFENGVQESAVLSSESMDLDTIETELNAVEVALGRLDDGTYGLCVACGGPIPDADLGADPTATICPAHLDLART